MNDARRSFLLSGGAVLGAWIAANWPAIAAAQAHVDQTTTDPDLGFLNAAEAADVEALMEQIVPGGATPGARDARALRFLDRALATFFGAWADEFRLGLSEFQAAFRLTPGGAGSFAAAGAGAQRSFLAAHDQGAFFDTLRLLTVLGMFTSPQYGGNAGGAGFQLLGFEDRHAFTPPFGHYDRDYAGFAPYPVRRA